MVSEGDPLDPEMVERLLKRTRPAENVVPLPKAQPVRALERMVDEARPTHARLNVRRARCCDAGEGQVLS